MFENPFLGMEGKMKKKLGENEEAGAHTRVEAEGMDGEQQMFETFVKEKSTLLGYVHDLIRFAAKLQDIDLEASKIFGDEVVTASSEERKGEDVLRIQDEKDCANIANRVNGVVSKDLSLSERALTLSFFNTL